jgi:hypothetical protein
MTLVFYITLNNGFKPGKPGKPGLYAYIVPNFSIKFGRSILCQPLSGHWTPFSTTLDHSLVILLQVVRKIPLIARLFWEQNNIDFYIALLPILFRLVNTLGE